MPLVGPTDTTAAAADVFGLEVDPLPAAVAAALEGVVAVAVAVAVGLRETIVAQVCLAIIYTVCMSGRSAGMGRIIECTKSRSCSRDATPTQRNITQHNERTRL